MKIKIFTVAALFLIIGKCGFAQTKKGTFVLSGQTNLNFQFSNTTIPRDSIASDRIENTQYNVTTGFGYFIANNFMVGVSGAYSYNYSKVPRTNYQSGHGNITSTVAVIPSLNYYFPLNGKLRPTLSIGAGYLWLTERDSKVINNDNVVYLLKGPSFNGAAGLSYFITPSVSFDLGLQYAYNKLKDEMKIYETQKQNAVAGTFGVSVFF